MLNVFYLTLIDFMLGKDIDKRHDAIKQNLQQLRNVMDAKDAEISRLRERLAEADEANQKVSDANADLRAEVEELQKATTPICVGRGVIGKMAKDGSWTSENGASVVAADELFRNDPYEQIDDLLASLKEAHELLHKLTAIIPGNDEAGKEAARLLARIRAERSWC